MYVEANLVHERALLHRELNLVYLADVRVCYLVVLDDEVTERHVLVVGVRTPNFAVMVLVDIEFALN